MRLPPVLAACLLLGCATHPPADHRGPEAVLASSAGEIHWHDWTAEAFTRAAAEDRMVLVDVGMEGCTACRWMDEKTYAHPEVVARIREHFIAIQVDSEARPDIGERYADWAWPATVFMAPDGEQVLALRGNKLPKNFLPILDQLIGAKAAGRLTGDGETPIVAPSEPATGELAEIRDGVVARIDARWHDPSDGWNRRLMSPLGPLVQHGLLRAHARGETVWQERALRTLAGWRKLIDPVWGGIFVASKDGWDDPIPEKRTRYQAAALQAFADAYWISGDEAWLSAARDIDRYLAEFMTAPDGTFFTSQEDDAPRLAEGMSAHRYYGELDDAGRRRHGIPPIDHAVYTDRNALVITAYAELYAATGDAQWRDRATKAAEALLSRQAESGVFVQYVPSELVAHDDRMRHPPGDDHVYLRAQGPMGLALLSLAFATGEPRWQEAAERLATGLRVTLEDRRAGGFFASDDASLDAIAPRRKPVEENAQAARFVYLLGVLTKSDGHREAAERALRAVTTEALLDAEGMLLGDTARALELVLTDAVEMSVVGREHDPAAADVLFAAARAVYEPRKVLHHQGPGRYPDQGRPALFICNDTACSRPITDPADVPAQAARFAAAQ